MKKRILFLLLALLMLLSACTGPAVPADTQPGEVELTVMGDSSPMPGFDAQNKFTNLPMSSFQETEDFFFGNLNKNRFLRYYDKVTGFSDYLCANPACTHSDATCSAYIVSNAAAFWYNGQRWWITQKENDKSAEYLYCSDLSGINQKSVKRIDTEEIVYVYQPQQYAIHRGNIFARCANTIVNGSEVTQRYALLASPLDGTEEFAVLFDQYIPSGAVNVMRFAGTKVYYSLWVRESESGAGSLTITSYDVATKEYATVFTEAGITDYLGEFWVTADGQVYLPGVDADAKGACLWKIEDGTRKKVYTLPEAMYMIAYLAEDVMITLTSEEEELGIQVWDFDGKLLASAAPMFPPEVPGVEGDLNTYRLNLMGGDKEKILLLMNGANTEHIILLDAQNNLEPTVLWSTGD